MHINNNAEYFVIYILLHLYNYYAFLLSCIIGISELFTYFNY